MFFKGPFGGAYLRREICVSKLIGLAYSSKEIYRFSLFDFVLEGTFQVQAPGGGGGRGLIIGGAIYRRVFCVSSLGGL